MRDSDILSLIKDESFLNYCFRSNQEDVDYWENWLNENPGLRAKVAEQKDLIIQLAHQSQNRELAVQVQNMKQLINQQSATTKHIGARQLVIKLLAAAVLIGVVTLGILYVQNSNKPDTLASSSEVKIRNKALLTLADGSKVVLDDVKNGTSIDENGIIISKNANGQIIYDASAVSNSSDKNAYNTVATPIGGQFEVILPDGTKVFLNAASSLQYPVSFNGKQRKVILNGEGYFEVAKNKKMPFSVSANGVDVQVLGTHFNISAYKNDDEIKTTLTEGSVRLQKGSHTTMLVPGQQGISVKDKSGITVRAANLDDVMAWRQGLIIFDNEGIREVMKKASRWYDIEVEYNGDFTDKKFFGRISRYDSIKDLLDNMVITSGITYKIEGRRILITD
ncbi:FecR family protein [Desertivirga xinjiangensis]|uniref:FecR family protein n=1 Tax=Desertivirga xinjiangensis TaxID=539206 RepID=UPI00210B7556|nr:FecR family protein [Pedobacter xinjiangensis]